METIKLYQVNCTLLLNNEEEIVDFAPKNNDLFYFQPSLEKAIEIYDNISPSQFDKKEVLKAKMKGFGDTYNKYILVVEMPLELYKSCFFEDNGDECSQEKTTEYINEMVWDDSVNWKIPNLKEVVFDINWHTMEFKNLRNYEPIPIL